MHVAVQALHRYGGRERIAVSEDDLVSKDPELAADAVAMATLDEFNEKNNYRCRLLANILKLETVLQTGTTRYRRGPDWGCTDDPGMYWDDREEPPTMRMWM